MMASEQTIELWSAQERVVIDALERDGVSRVKMAYVERKYAKSAWAFREAYGFFRRESARMMELPEGAESAIWLYADKSNLYAGPGSYVLKLVIPCSRVILFDSRMWNTILNLSYIPADEADAQRFRAELERMGITDTRVLFETPFYPLQKRRVQESWKRLFSSADGCPTCYLQAAVWELRRSWVQEIIPVSEDPSQVRPVSSGERPAV